MGSPAKNSNACFSQFCYSSIQTLFFFFFNFGEHSVSGHEKDWLQNLSSLIHRKPGHHSDLTLANWIVPSRILNIKGDEGTVRIIFNIDPGRGSSSNIDYFYLTPKTTAQFILFQKELVHSHGLNFMNSSSGFHNLVVHMLSIRSFSVVISVTKPAVSKCDLVAL